jgi:hypothetical protein
MQPNSTQLVSLPTGEAMAAPMYATSGGQHETPTTREIGSVLGISDMQVRRDEKAHEAATGVAPDTQSVVARDGKVYPAKKERRPDVDDIDWTPRVEPVPTATVLPLPTAQPTPGVPPTLPPEVPTDGPAEEPETSPEPTCQPTPTGTPEPTGSPAPTDTPTPVPSPVPTPTGEEVPELPTETPSPQSPCPLAQVFDMLPPAG